MIDNIRKTSAQSHYPYGSPLSERMFSPECYRFGFNGQEMDNEISGQTGTHTTAMFWEYDSRLGRRWNLDPKPQISISDYACFANNPVWFSDPFGDKIIGSWKDKRAFKKREKASGTWATTKATYKGKNAERDLILSKITNPATIQKYNIQDINHAQIQTSVLSGQDDESKHSRSGWGAIDHLYFSPLVETITKTFIYNTQRTGWYKKGNSFTWQYEAQVGKDFRNGCMSINDFLEKKNQRIISANITVNKVSLEHDDINRYNPGQYWFYLDGGQLDFGLGTGNNLTTDIDGETYNTPDGPNLNPSQIINVTEIRNGVNGITDACHGFYITLTVTKTRYRK